jgi:hypothetical protein
LIGVKPRRPEAGRLKNMDISRSRLFRSFTVALLLCVAWPAVAAAPSAPVQREIIPGSELMSSQERERYRLRLRGAGTPAERERLRAEHLRAMEERARLRGLTVIDYSRAKKTP